MELFSSLTMLQNIVCRDIEIPINATSEFIHFSNRTVFVCICVVMRR